MKNWNHNVVYTFAWSECCNQKLNRKTRICRFGWAVIAIGCCLLFCFFHSFWLRSCPCAQITVTFSHQLFFLADGILNTVFLLFIYNHISVCIDSDKLVSLFCREVVSSYILLCSVHVPYVVIYSLSLPYLISLHSSKCKLLHMLCFFVCLFMCMRDEK